MKNYWSELRKNAWYIYVGKEGWEVPIINGKPEFRCKIPNVAKREAREEVAMVARMARACNTEDEYKKLCKRIGKEDWPYIIENDLKGASLIRWAYNTHTSEEYYKLLRYN